MGHDKLRKFAENETFGCLLQPDSREILEGGFFDLKDHPIKGNWAREMFGRESAEIVLELGCGKGEYTLDLARRYPDKCFIGVDIKGARLWKGAKTATLEKIPNVAFLRTRIEFITAFFAPGEISEIWLTFSDPQMKSENSRLTSPLFLERYRSFLKPGGLVHLKTDSRFLYEYTRAVIRANGLEERACVQDLYAGVAEDGSAVAELAGACRGAGDEQGAKGIGINNQTLDPVVYEVQTFYEKMFLEMGLPITYLEFCIDHSGEYLHPEDFDEKYWRESEGPRRSFGHGEK
ncbi:MAG: tRNA (guanosine(46)-N7)-methyltransferase TrmB [Candidatus Cryptobacteroides sp.]